MILVMMKILETILLVIQQQVFKVLYIIQLQIHVLKDVVQDVQIAQDVLVVVKVDVEVVL